MELDDWSEMCRNSRFIKDSYLTLPLASDANMPPKQRAAKTMNATLALVKKEV